MGFLLFTPVERQLVSNQYLAKQALHSQAMKAPAHLLRSLNHAPLTYQPAVLMVRAGLLVKPEVMAQAEQLQVALSPAAMWGMSPFGGNDPNQLFSEVSLSSFLVDSSSFEPTSVAAIALRLSFYLPEVSHIAVSTNSCFHLADLLSGSSISVDSEQIARYRLLLSRFANS
jgi:hypothetical protein